MKSISSSRIERLRAIEDLLLAAPNGLTQAALAHKLGVHRSTIHRDLACLPKNIFEDGERLFIDRQSYLLKVTMSLHEAMAVHLAVRLLTTRLERQNPHAASAVRKLGLALEKLAPRISAHLVAAADEQEGASHRQDPVYLGILEKLTLAWAEQRGVEIWHRREDGQVSRHVLAPYFIEPNAVGQSTYVIGRCLDLEALRTFKVERIERAELGREVYEIPADFDAGALFADAWGIWYTGQPPVEVELLFSARVRGRVLETRWHRSETVEEAGDGRLRWRARIAEPREMMPWIRGWGADVEVVGPAGLREQIREQVNCLFKIYNGN